MGSLKITFSTHPPLIVEKLLRNKNINNNIVIHSKINTYIKKNIMKKLINISELMPKNG